ncbi:MAG: hypothetical protein ACK46X_13060, partial [Candidatus Sericytochromatia bacterium]
HRLIAMFVGLCSLWVLSGCQAPLVPVPTGAERPVQASVTLGGYRTLAVVAANTVSRVDHLTLTLSVRNAQGQYVATGASKVIARAALGSPVSLGNLKMGQAYRVQASAYTDAAETQLVSDPARSVTDFVMPSLSMANGVATLNDAPVTLALKVALVDATYAGRAAFTVTLANNVRNKADSLRLTLYQVSGTTHTQVYRQTVPYTSGAALGYTLTNLKFGTSYALLAEAYDGAAKLSADANSSTTFSVPAPTDGQLNDDVNAVVGAIDVPCRR